MRRDALGLLALGALLLGACGSGAEAGEPDRGPAPSTVALTGLAALEPVATPGPSTTVPRPEPLDVVVVGDSLALSAREEISELLAVADVDLLAFDAVEGRRTADGVHNKPSGKTAVAELAARHDPDVWVIALGTNDVGGQARPDEFRADVLALLDELPPTARIVWLDTWIKSRIDGCRELNAVLREVAAERGAMTVVDWFQFGDDPGLIVSDGVHLTDQGQLRFAEQIVAALRAA